LFEHEYYPTPKGLIDTMLTGIDFKYISSVLEPSAGKGDLIEAVMDKFKYSHIYSYNREAIWDIDAIEIDENLQFILQGKKHRVVHNDFLTYDTYKKYDLIIANPPFSTGDKHLLKALEMQENGGQIICLLNAETLKNPYNNIRKDLVDKLERYDAEIKYIQNAFISAEVKTNVEIALVRVNIPKTAQSSIILEGLRQQEVFREEVHNSGKVVNADFLKGIVQKYNFEVKAGLRLIAEYEAMKPFILSSFKEDSSNTILNLTVNDKDGNCSKENSYIKQVRMKYWLALFTNEEFMGLFTSNLRQKYQSKISELKDYDFSIWNIYTIKAQLNNEMVKGVEDTILSLFEEFSHKHHWHDETSKNVHYFNGWKTNKGWKINKKVITVLNGFNSWDKNQIDYDYKVVDKLTDTEKVFNYLDMGATEDINIKETLKFAQGYGDTKKIPLKYFTVTFYKKGTCHIEFTNLDLLHKFNLFGSQRKGWLPPSYGKTDYKNMTNEEKTIIDEFEGKESYANVMSNKDYFIVETSKLLLLA